MGALLAACMLVSACGEQRATRLGQQRDLEADRAALAAELSGKGEWANRPSIVRSMVVVSGAFLSTAPAKPEDLVGEALRKQGWRSVARSGYEPLATYCKDWKSLHVFREGGASRRVIVSLTTREEDGPCQPPA